MPTYDYQCEKCGTFEFFQRIKEEPLKKCPKCHGKVKRLISPGVGLIFKGSGFYITDYKRKGSSSEEGSQKTISHSNSKTGKGSRGADKKDRSAPASESKSGEE